MLLNSLQTRTKTVQRVRRGIRTRENSPDWLPTVCGPTAQKGEGQEMGTGKETQKQ